MSNAGWKRISQVYQKTTVLVFNTLLALVLGILLINGLVPSQDDLAQRESLNKGQLVPVGVNVNYSDRFNRGAYYYSSPEEVGAMLAEYDAMSLAGHWMVHPWTGLTMRPFNGKYLNIDKNGLRAGIPPNAAFANKVPLVVWAFGGSTLFGWGLADNVSIPSLLQVELQKHFPERQLQVVNFAVPIYDSSQELALFAANLRTDRPDVAFFFDGVNDLWFTMNANTQTALVDPLAAVWEQHTFEITHPEGGDWITFNPSFPALRLARQLGLNSGLVGKDTFSPQYAMQGVYAPSREALLQTAINNYRANRQMANALGDAMGVKTYFFLQPYPADQVDFPVFRQDLTENNAVGNFYDISDLFETVDLDGHIALIDDFHYSDYGSQLIAERIADKLVK
ncbi:MAG: SGNH/GDSL hydrolase family protein [Anaerolineae bacterium]